MNARALPDNYFVAARTSMGFLYFGVLCATTFLTSGCRVPRKQASAPPTSAALQATESTHGFAGDSTFTAGPYTDNSSPRVFESLAEVGTATLPSAAEASTHAADGTVAHGTVADSTPNQATVARDMPERPALDSSAGLSSLAASGGEASPAAASSNQTSQQSEVASLTIRVQGVLPNQGPIRLAAFNDPKNFPEPTSASWVDVVESTQKELQITCPASGRVAIAVFQDINNDGQLNRGRFGIPLEPYAFSNQAHSTRGPPLFAEAAMVVSKPNTAVDIQLPDYKNVDFRSLQ